MKIICTEEEFNTACNTDGCVIDKFYGEDKSAKQCFKHIGNCSDCIKDNIEVEITDAPAEHQCSRDEYIGKKGKEKNS